MSYSFRIENKKDFLLIKASGQDSIKASKDIYHATLEAASKDKVYKVVVLSEMKPVSVNEAWDMQEIFFNNLPPFPLKIAWIDSNMESLEMNTFTEHVLVNRGLLNTKVFSDRNRAMEWLMKE